MTFEDKLKEINRMVSAFSTLVKNFPLSTSYKDSLVKLQQERAELVDTLGRGK